MSIKQLLFGSKVDLDSALASLLMGARLCETSIMAMRVARGSASAEELSDSTILVVEAGGSGRTAENNFDHHGPGAPDASSAAQVYKRIGRLVQYVDELDRGYLSGLDRCEFPSLSQLFAGMLLSVKDPTEQMRHGQRILQEILESGVDPYGSMTPILDDMPGARAWAQVKREHDKKGGDAIASTTWYTTKNGRKLAVLETTWFGAPGALMGVGAEVIVACNPSHGDLGIKKFTVASNRDVGVTVTPALVEIKKLEEGWGGPAHGTIIGSPMDRSSALAIEEVMRIVIETL